ncbi:dynamin family protein [Prevotella sp.]|uniref:dynamin family protein n=1 Tax=Prevotella sp. TaxID=59823 RepID=UPI0026000B63|nr:dynamin family protein [Prevotella sp.]
MLENEYKILNDAIASVSSSMVQSQRGKKIAEIKKSLDEIVNNPTTILICGEFKRGKSTFVNALIGRKVCPTDTDICTSTVTCIKYGEKVKATRLYGDFSNLRTQEIDFDDIERYTVGSAEEIDNTVCIEVELPLPELQKGLTIIDTPGVGGLDPRHAALTNFFLPRADITLFMTDVNEPLTITELNYFKNKVLQYARHSAIIVNKADLKDEKQVEEIRVDTLNKISSYTQVEVQKLNVISVSSADCIREEPQKGNFPALRQLINKLVTNFKMESFADLRDTFSEQLEFAITPLQVQLNQIKSPSMDQIKELSFKKDDIDRQIKDLADPQSSFRLSVNKKMSTERESIIMWLNNECIMLANDGFNALLHDNRATSTNGGKWLGEQIKQKIDELGSEITLQLNKAFERIASYEEFDGFLRFKASKYRGQVVVKDVDLSVPIHKRVLSSTPGWGIFMMGVCLLGAAPLALAASALAGGYVGIRNNIDTATTMQEGKLRQMYQSQIQTETQNLRTYVEGRFSDFQREWIRAISNRAQEYRDSLKEAISEIQNLKQQINIAVNKKVSLENRIKPLVNAKTTIDNMKLR